MELLLFGYFHIHVQGRLTDAIAFDFVDPDKKRKAYGSRHLDNISPPKYSHLAHDGDNSTCSSTTIASAKSHRAISPFWSIYFINNTRFKDFQLVLSDNKTLRDIVFVAVSWLVSLSTLFVREPQNQDFVLEIEVSVSR
ncbi:hypothetical protein MAR_023089 [Mya arenaria]|uniref:Uncharacterized protein n=1 Tax=Mya arenaria TaxID=6604 RepID=A0ABY7DLZ9_MYAAR|nr:hypothetical protein MAR_023089 [Mya arenaria]